MKEFVLHVTKAENGYVIKLSPPFNTPGSILPYQVWIVGENDKLHEVIAQAIVSVKMEGMEDVNSQQMKQFELYRNQAAEIYRNQVMQNSYRAYLAPTNVTTPIAP